MALGYLLGAAFQAEDSNGKPLTGGTVRVCLHNTTEPYITYKDFEGNLNPEYIPLDESGMAVIIVDDGNAYDVYCYNRFGGDAWSRLNVTVGGSGGGGGGTYIAGNGILIVHDVISVDTSTIQEKITVDQTYDSTSSNPQSGTAVADALSSISTVPTPQSSDVNKVLSVINAQGELGWSATATGVAVIWCMGPTFDQYAKNTAEAVHNAIQNGFDEVFLVWDGHTDYRTIARLVRHYDRYYDDGPVLSYSFEYTTYEYPAVVLRYCELYCEVTSEYKPWHWLVRDCNFVPSRTASDANKVLGVTDSSGTLGWVSQNGSLPSMTGNAGKVLTVNSGATAAEWAAVPSELPSITGHAYDFLAVNAAGTGVEWTQPTGYWTQSVDLSSYRTLTAEDIAAGYVDFETAITASNTSSSITNPAYAALSWDVRLNSGLPSSAVSSIDFALGVSGGSYDTIFSDNNPAHEVHKDWGITRSWVLNTRKNRVRARCNLASGASVGTVINMSCGGIVTQVR